MSIQPDAAQHAAPSSPQEDADARAVDGDYAVDHRRPPMASRFKPGVSGNPRGRPKAPRAPANR